MQVDGSRVCRVQYVWRVVYALAGVLIRESVHVATAVGILSCA